MAQTVIFPGRLTSPRKPKRHLTDKFQEIALRSPKDLAAFETVADHVLARLNDEESQRQN